MTKNSSQILGSRKCSFHNIEAAEIARSWPKPAELKVKLEICLKIENRLANLYAAKRD